MKKILALALAVMLMATLTMTAFAADPITTEGSKDIDVKAEYKDNSTTPDSICVDIEWGAMEFTYTVNGEMKWNANEHDYDDNTSGTWSPKGNTITLTNHSNVKVSASFTFTLDTEHENLSYEFSKTSVEMPSAVGLEKTDETLRATTDLRLKGKLNSNTTTMSHVGTITVNFRKAA